MTAIPKPGGLDLIRLGIALGWAGITVTEARSVSATPGQVHMPIDLNVLAKAADELATAWCDEPSTGRLASTIGDAVEDVRCTREVAW